MRSFFEVFLVSGEEGAIQAMQGHLHLHHGATALSFQNLDNWKFLTIYSSMIKFNK
jgi:hypothetical protein